MVLLLGAELAAEVDGLRRALGDPALGRIPPHVTLVPPVNVPEGRLPDALALLRAAAAATRPFRLVLGPPATFWPVNPVVHLPVGGDDNAVVTLRDRVMRPPLARSVTLPFVPHVTLADGCPPERIEAALAALAGYEVTAFVDRVHLLCQGPGRVWAAVADAVFAAPAVVGRGGLELELTVSEHLDPEAAAFAASQEVDVAATFAVTARRGGEVVGVATGRVRGDDTVLERLVVDGAHRGEGIGAHVLAAVESWAAERGWHLCRHMG